MKITKIAFLAIIENQSLFIFREKKDNIWKLPNCMVLGGENLPTLLREKFESSFPEATVEIGDCIYSFLYNKYSNVHKHISLEKEIFAVEVYSGKINGIITEEGINHSINTQYFGRKMEEISKMVTGLLIMDGYVNKGGKQ